MGDVGTVERILEHLACAGIGPIPDVSRELLGVFVREVGLWSGRIHLIGKSNIRRTIRDQIVDSWLMYQLACEGGIVDKLDREGAGRRAVRVADIGSGAGFPGVVWKIADPELDVTLFERREKTLRFLERVVTLMQVEGIRAVGGEAGLSHESPQYDIVLSKAAGRLPVLAPVAARLLAAAGAYITVKGEGWEDESGRIGPTPLQLASVGDLPTGRGTVLTFVRKNNTSGG